MLHFLKGKTELIYEYECSKCGNRFDVVKKVKDMDRPESCTHCGCTETERVFNPKIHLHSTSVEDAYYNTGLGEVVRSRSQAKEIAERKGLVEIGTEKPETIYKESVVKKQEQREKEWEAL